MWTTIAVPLGGLGWLLYADYSLKAGFETIEIGQGQERVESILGKPSGLQKCGYFGGTVGREIPSSCVKEHSYLSVLSFTEVWAVGFDDTKWVVWKYHYQSP